MALGQKIAAQTIGDPVSYTHLDVYKRQILTGQCQIKPDETRKLMLNGGELTLTSGKRVKIDGVRKLFYQWEDADIRLQEAVEIARQTYRTRYPTALKLSLIHI